MTKIKKLRFRDIWNAAIHRINLIGIRIRLFCQFRFHLMKDYQPNPFSDHAFIKNVDGRECYDRFHAISDVLPNKPLSVMDIGCNIGYFVFRMAERGGFCLGIDWGRNQIMVARSLAELHRVNNAVFSEMEVDPKSITSLPKVDVVICLSIFHHWVRRYGEQKAREMLISLASRAEKYIIFETGQPDEAQKPWSRLLHFMNQPDFETWVKEFLHTLGFEKVELCGPFPTSVSDVPRKLFIGIRLH